MKGLWCVLAGVVGFAGVGRAFDPDGQAAIGMTAMSGVKSETLSQLKRLLGGKDIVDVSHWSHTLIDRYPAMGLLFEQVQIRDLSHQVNCEYFNPDEDCANGNCLVRAIQHYYNLMLPETATKTVPKKKEKKKGKNSPNSGGNPSEFRLPIERLRMSDTDNMKMLVALLAELHSPSKFGYSQNRLGRDVSVNFQDAGRKIPTNLFKYWDSDLIQKTVRDRPQFWYSGWTHVGSYKHGYLEQETRNFNQTEDKDILFEIWAKETWKLACTKVWRKKSHQAAPQTMPEVDMLVPTNAIFSPQQMAHDFDILRQQILLGGIRTAVVLNDLLSRADARRLRIGSAVNIDHLKPKAPTAIWAGGAAKGEGPPQNWFRNMAINLAIIAVVVGIFALFVRYSSEGASVAGALHNKVGASVQMKANKD